MKGTVEVNRCELGLGGVLVHKCEFTISSVMGLLAQLVERPARDWKDVGSNPTPARSFSDSMDSVSKIDHHI